MVAEQLRKSPVGQFLDFNIANLKDFSRARER